MPAPTDRADQPKPADYPIVPAAPCPNCHAPLDEHALEGLYGRSLVIDVCTACQGIWFDEGESLQLAPRGTLTLFRLISGERPPVGDRPLTGDRPPRPLEGACPPARRPLSERLECPRCRLRLTLTADQQRATKFQYHRCAREHGRFITFFHFLRARNFVRSLTPREVADLRAKIRQIHCSNCAAPLDLEKDVACAYCRAPISMLDPDQVKSALAELQEADARRQTVDPALPLTLMMERLKTEKLFAETAASGRRQRPWTFSSVSSADASFGLVEAGMDLVLSWLADT